ncbi:MAG: hypothetical protein RBU37_01545 [Myxococcota bacterium]|jgi:hypothetical protein|nr:hypothetical protein [Myxococcota bacterium]
MKKGLRGSLVLLAWVSAVLTCSTAYAQEDLVQPPTPEDGEVQHVDDAATAVPAEVTEGDGAELAPPETSLTDTASPTAIASTSATAPSSLPSTEGASLPGSELWVSSPYEGLERSQLPESALDGYAIAGFSLIGLAVSSSAVGAMLWAQESPPLGASLVISGAALAMGSALLFYLSLESAESPAVDELTLSRPLSWSF